MSKWGCMVVVALLAACASKSGRLPDSVIDLYDRGAPDGWMEIEAERDGTIIEVEADIAVADLPPAVVAAGKKALPGGRITGGEYEIVEGVTSYEVKMTKGGRDYEFVFTLDGELVESEKELQRGEAPAGIVEAALQAVPGTQFKSVEIVTKGGEEVYHVKTTRRRATYKIVVAPDGTVLRKVREARCEIEIPLK